MNTNQENMAICLSERRQQLIIWTLLCIMPIVGMTVDLISPSLPAIALALNVSTSLVKDIISVYLLGYALGNFFAGFLTDAFGRRKLLLIGIIGFVGASLLPVFFQKIDILLVARFLQGFTIGMVSVTSRAVFSDILPAEKLVKLGVLIGSMFGVGPIIGPFLGGYLQFYFGWTSCFIFFAGIMGILLILIFFIVPETHFNRHALNYKVIKHNLLEVLRHKRFMGTIIIMGVVYSSAVAFNTVGPFLVQTKLHYSPVFFGKIGLFMGAFFMISTLLVRCLLNKYSVDKILSVAVKSSWIIALVTVFLGYWYDGNIILLCIASGVMFFAQGIILPMCLGNGLSLFRHIAGTAVATMGLFNVLIASAVAFILSFINVENTVSLFLIYFCLATVSLIMFYICFYEKR